MSNPFINNKNYTNKKRSQVVICNKKDKCSKKEQVLINSNKNLKPTSFISSNYEELNEEKEDTTPVPTLNTTNLNMNSFPINNTLSLNFNNNSGNIYGNTIINGDLTVTDLSSGTSPNILYYNSNNGKITYEEFDKEKYVTKQQVLAIVTPLINYIDKLSKTYAIIEENNGNETEYIFEKPNLLNILELL